ncbi:hypothetical protein [Pseudomonas huanghezhanensis]|uniref:hypothetical protein n=1 Tax=Pseudomonas huanghezhanensis TaxID=3002903 RepID=UPI002285DCEC|nr:hypothetical protein [Pseudomonas sp. BSw22131]
MQAQHLSSSGLKAITSTYPDEQVARHLMTIRIVGTAIFDYQVRKTPDARIRLECLATMAQAQGDLTDVEALVVAKVLATHTNPHRQDQHHV